MATLHDLERTIVFLASNYASAICQLDGTESRAKETSDRLIAAREEVEALLAENSALRADIDGLESLIHRLVDRVGIYHSDLKHTCGELHKRRTERDDARQTIGLVRLDCEHLRAEVKRLKKGKGR